MTAPSMFNPFRNKRARIDAMIDVQDDIKTQVRGDRQSKNHPGGANLQGLPSDLFVRCSECGRTITHHAMDGNLWICPTCGFAMPLPADRRLKSVFDGGRYKEFDTELVGCDPLGFPDYEEKLANLRHATHLREAALSAVGRIGGIDTVVVVLDARFLMGSMGVAVGEKVTRAVERATEERMPLVIFSASGGARMQEGIFSLMQMAKTSAAIARHAEAGILYISVMTHPTTGGVTASFASLGDIIVAEPHALIGFAGPRVIQQTINQKLPANFQRAESVRDCGFLDAIVARHDMRDFLLNMLHMHACGFDSVDKERAAESIAPLRLSNLSPVERVTMARSRLRPGAEEYIAALFSDFQELAGDRLCGDDGSIIGGIALFRGMPVTVIGQRKGHDVESNIACNFGMTRPEGYRKAMRLVRQAEKFHRPVITIVDTPGAYPGIEAEQRGQGEAIARCIELFSEVRVPVIAVFVGEGGSGGALALATADRVIMLENAIFSILSPEGFASILWKDSARADEACELMRLTAEDLEGFGVVDEVIAEGEGGVQENTGQVVESLASTLSDMLDELAATDPDALVDRRYQRYRNMGPYAETVGTVPAVHNDTSTLEGKRTNA